MALDELRVVMNTKPKKEKPTKDIKNGVTRPKPTTITGDIWAICDYLTQETGCTAKRADVVEIGSSKKYNPSTIATQYGRWCKYNGISKVRAPKKVKSKVTKKVKSKVTKKVPNVPPPPPIK